MTYWSHHWAYPTESEHSSHDRRIALPDSGPMVGTIVALFEDLRQRAPNSRYQPL